MSLIVDFLFPTNCVVCGATPSVICPGCQPKSERLKVTLGELELVAAERFEGDVASIIRIFKDRKLIALAKVLAELVDQSIELDPDCEFLAFPPSSKAHFRRRGFHPVQLIAERSKTLSSLARLPVRMQRQIAEQRQLGAASRAENLRESFRVKPGSGRVLLFDDVVTTGATMGELARAVGAAGYEIAGGCAITVSSGFPVLPQAKKGVVCS
jgi:predicted amidophosphoribosyltransferase